MQNVISTTFISYLVFSLYFTFFQSKRIYETFCKSLPTSALSKAIVFQVNSTHLRRFSVLGQHYLHLEGFFLYQSVTSREDRNYSRYLKQREFIIGKWSHKRWRSWDNKQDVEATGRLATARRHKCSYGWRHEAVWLESLRTAEEGLS